MDENNTDYILQAGEKEAIGMEATMGYRRFLKMRTPNLQETIDYYFNNLLMQKEEQEGYRRCGKYLVKESFSGDVILTELLTEYIERTTSLKY